MLNAMMVLLSRLTRRLNLSWMKVDVGEIKGKVGSVKRVRVARLRDISKVGIVPPKKC